MASGGRGLYSPRLARRPAPHRPCTISKSYMHLHILWPNKYNASHATASLGGAAGGGRAGKLCLKLLLVRAPGWLVRELPARRVARHGAGQAVLGKGGVDLHLHPVNACLHRIQGRPHAQLESLR